MYSEEKVATPGICTLELEWGRVSHACIYPYSFFSYNLFRVCVICYALTFAVSLSFPLPVNHSLSFSLPFFPTFHHTASNGFTNSSVQ
jgi:hypothetical protein